jgi:hypothetical protein
MMFAILDVNAKAIYSAILLGHNFFTIDQMEAFYLLAKKKGMEKKTSKNEENVEYSDYSRNTEAMDKMEKTETMNKLLMLAKREVEKTKQLQIAFLTGVMCFCTFVMIIFYAPRLYELFIIWNRPTS